MFQSPFLKINRSPTMQQRIKLYIISTQEWLESWKHFLAAVYFQICGQIAKKMNEVKKRIICKTGQFLCGIIFDEV